MSNKQWRGREFKAWRRMAKLTQGEVAAAVGVSVAEVVGAERNDRPIETEWVSACITMLSERARKAQEAVY